MRSVVAGGILWLAAVIAAGVCDRAVAADAKARVQANFRPLRDASGMNWDLTPNGTVNDGESDCFDTGLILRVNNTDFSVSQPAQMSGDGAEYFLSRRNMPQRLNVERRIRPDMARSFLQYLEVFTNNGDKDAPVVCEINSNLGSQPQMLATDKGQPYPGGGLGKGGFGAVALQNPGDSRPSVAFLLCDARSKLKPAVSLNGNTVTIRYEFSLKPKETAAILYLVSQRRQGASIQAFYDDVYKRQRLQKISLPKELANCILNFPARKPGESDDSEAAAARSALQPLLAQCEALGLERGADDLLVIDGNSSLRGTISAKRYQVKTAFGPLEVPVGEIAAIRGGGGADRQVQTILRSGEILAGTVAAEEFKISTDKGLTIGLDPAKANLIILRRQPEDGYSAPGTAVIVRLHTGDALALSAQKAVPLQAATPWGRLAIELTGLRGLKLERDPNPIYKAALADGSRLPVILYGEALPVQTVRFGAIDLSPQSVLELYAGVAKTKPQEESEEPDNEYELDAVAPCFRLGEGIVAAGTFGLPALAVATANGVTEVPAEQIRHLEQQDVTEETKNNLQFKLTLMGGGTITGGLGMRMIPVQTRSGTLQVPVQHLREYCGKRPPAPAKEAAKEPAAEAAKKPDGEAANPSAKAAGSAAGKQAPGTPVPAAAKTPTANPGQGKPQDSAPAPAGKSAPAVPPAPAPASDPTKATAP